MSGLECDLCFSLCFDVSYIHLKWVFVHMNLVTKTLAFSKRRFILMGVLKLGNFLLEVCPISP